jgi:hypothetical protein
MKGSAFYELIDVLKDKNKNKIEYFIEKYSVEDVLLAFKGNGFGVNAFPESKSYNEYLNIRPGLYSKASRQRQEHLINGYDFDIEILNALFDDFYLKEQFEVVTQVADDKKLYAFLIAFELYVRGLINRKFDGGENKEFFGDIDIQKNINGKVTGID